MQILKNIKCFLLVVSSFFMLFGSNARADVVEDGITVNGYVKDAQNGEMLVGATVVINGTVKGTVTNVYGFFSVELLPGENTLQFGFLGYQTTEMTFETGRQVTVELIPHTETLDELVVTVEGGAAS
jgi:hypothetical protein